MGRQPAQEVKYSLRQPTILAGRRACELAGERIDALLLRLFRAEIRRLERAGAVPTVRTGRKPKALASHLASSSNPSVMYGPGGLAENTTPASADPPTT